MYQYLLRLAGTRILCRTPFEVTVTRESAEFLEVLTADAEIEADFTYTFCAVETLPALPVEGNWFINFYFSGNRTFRRIAPGKQVFTMVERSIDQREITCHYLPEYVSELSYSKILWEMLNLEVFLLSIRALMLHASFIRWQDRAVLFSAPSGTGKSTQADLWVKYEQAELLNGDKTGLLREGDVWTAFGLPYAGSSAVYRNELVPVGAIVVLRQGPENIITRLRPMEALRHLYPETAMHRWDVNLAGQALEILEEMVTQVPVYLLSCRPDQGAVETLKETLMTQF